MNIQCPLKSIRGLGIGVRTATEGTITTAGGCIVPFQVIGMDVLIMRNGRSFWVPPENPVVDPGNYVTVFNA